MKKIMENVYWLLGRGYDCNVFLITSDDDSLLVDSGLGNRFLSNSGSLKELRDCINSFNVEKIFLTHGHIDHVGGLLELQNEYSLKVLATSIEASFLKDGDNAFIDPIMNTNCPPIEVHSELKDGDVIHIGDFTFTLLHTPGHTIGSSCLWEKNKKILLSGDTVFPGGSFGRTDFPTGSNYDLTKSIERLSSLDVETMLPGHMIPILKNAKKSIKESLYFSKTLF